MSRLYQDMPTVSNEYSTGWIDDEYQPSEADYEEWQEAQLESEIDAADIGTKRRLREMLDRTIADYERSLEDGGPAPW